MATASVIELISESLDAVREDEEEGENMGLEMPLLMDAYDISFDNSDDFFQTV